jgi:hypothetical protein|nr:MAG TPA: Protein of unknown function (DUF1642) [Caudoviricetes sp.]
MKIEELIGDYERVSNFCEKVSVDKLIQKLKQLDEPEKVKVPQFVADFIAEQKKLGHTLSYSIDASMSDRVAEWYWDNSELFARAWLDRYEVEKEPKYTVRVKGINGYGQYLNKASSSKTYCFASEIEKYGYKTKHTRKELEDAGFGWIFSCEGIEVEEVE